MKPVPFTLKKCDLMGCEIQAHFVLADGRYICAKHAAFFGVGAKLCELKQEEVDARAEPDMGELLEEAEGEKMLPGDEVDGLKPQR